MPQRDYSTLIPRKKDSLDVMLFLERKDWAVGDPSMTGSTGLRMVWLARVLALSCDPGAETCTCMCCSHACLMLGCAQRNMC